MRATLTALAVLLASPAMGQQCAPRAPLIEQLADGYGESRQSIALDGRGLVVEVFANLETGTWTITVTPPGGLTCIVAAGQSYERVEPEPPRVDG